MKKRFYFFLASLLFMVVGMQKAWGQGFRVYQSDGTELQFSLKTDSIVFDNGLSGDEVFGPFTPVNQCIAKTWYKTKTETVTFNADGTTDYLEPNGTYKFFPYQGTVVIYNAAGRPVTNFRVLEVTADQMLVSEYCNNYVAVWATTPQPVLVEEIILSDMSLTLVPDETKDLTATVLPYDADNQAVTWESSDEEVAEVSKKGKVIANAVGTCTITCRATDGSGTYAQCLVTVSDIVYVQLIELSETSISFDAGMQYTINAFVYPDNATNKTLAWETSDEAIAMVEDGVIKGVAPGTCTITCRATDGSGLFAECQVKVQPHHAYVDLGLPSGTLWATMNVGASSPEEIGDYFAWGETQPKSSYTEENYTYPISYANPFLSPENDAATANWGLDWKMPTYAQAEELINPAYTTSVWTTQNGVEGYKITSNFNSKSIFLPVTGYYYTDKLYDADYGHYWTQGALDNYPEGIAVQHLNFDSGDDSYITTISSYGPEHGMPVRPVRKQ